MFPIIPVFEYTVLGTNDAPGLCRSDLQISLRITERCNLSCPYCLWNHDIKYDTQDVITSINQIYELLATTNQTSVLFYFHGGEPSTHPGVVAILQHIRQAEHDTRIDTRIEFQTNLIMKQEKLTQILPLINGLNVSLHLKELIKSQTLPIFEANYEYLKTIHCEILNLDIMLEYGIDNMFRYLRKTLSFLKYDNVKVSEMIYAYIDFSEEPTSYNKSIRYKEFELYQKLYKKHNRGEQQYRIDGTVYNTNDLFLHKLNCKGMLCVAGIAHLVVNGDGNVFLCNTLMTNFINNRGGTAFTNLIHDPLAVRKLSALNRTKHIRCPVNECSSDFYFDKSF